MCLPDKTKRTASGGLAVALCDCQLYVTGWQCQPRSARGLSRPGELGDLPDLPDLSALPDSPLYLVLAHFSRQRVAVDAERVSRSGQAAVAAPQHACNEALLELMHRIAELDVALDHLLDQFLEPFGN